MRALSVLLSILGGAAIAVAILACSATHVIATDVVERTIAGGLAQQGLEIAHVACPTGHAARAGETLTCTAYTAGDDAIAVDVEVLDDSGRVKWDLRGVVVHEKVIADRITEQMRGAIQVKCPDKIIVVPVGGSFVCEAGSGGNLSQHMSITITDKDGKETWNLVP